MPGTLRQASITRGRPHRPSERTRWAPLISRGGKTRRNVPVRSKACKSRVVPGGAGWLGSAVATDSTRSRPLPKTPVRTRQSPSPSHSSGGWLGSDTSSSISPLAAFSIRMRPSTLREESLQGERIKRWTAPVRAPSPSGPCRVRIWAPPLGTVVRRRFPSGKRPSNDTAPVGPVPRPNSTAASQFPAPGSRLVRTTSVRAMLPPRGPATAWGRTAAVQQRAPPQREKQKGSRLSGGASEIVTVWTASSARR